jgi:deoxyribodipyrimidine photo-lyase
MIKEKVAIVWFRRDLRLEDNTALIASLSAHENVLPLFIFDDDILGELPKNDPRVNFIYTNLKNMNQRLRKEGSSMLIVRGKINEVWKKLIDAYSIESV